MQSAERTETIQEGRRDLPAQVLQPAEMLAAMTGKGKRYRLDRKENRIAFLFILPSLLWFLIFIFAPMIFSIILSFSNYEVLTQSYTFIGLKNYINLFNYNTSYGEQFVRCILNTLIIAIEVPIAMAFGLLCAVLVSSQLMKLSKVYRILIYLPVVCGAVASNIIWRYLFKSGTYDMELGVINYYFGIHVNWLTERGPLLTAIIIKNTIGGMGSSMVLYYAGICGISQEYYEVADLDGANAFNKFWHITFPMLTPTTFYLLIMRVSGALQAYADAAIFANKSPYAQTIVYFIWDRGINAYSYGIATAAATLLGIVIMGITVLQFRFSKKWVVEL